MPHNKELTDYFGKYADGTYQPVWAYIPELDEILQYDVMCSTKESELSCRNNPNYVFLGYGHQVYTCYENNTDLRVEIDERLTALFVRVQ